MHDVDLRTEMVEVFRSELLHAVHMIVCVSALVSCASFVESKIFKMAGDVK